RNLMVFLRPIILRDAITEAAVSSEKYNFLRTEQMLMREDKSLHYRGDKQPLLPPIDPVTTSDLFRNPPPLDPRIPEKVEPRDGSGTHTPWFRLRPPPRRHHCRVRDGRSAGG